MRYFQKYSKRRRRPPGRYIFKSLVTNLKGSYHIALIIYIQTKLMFRQNLHQLIYFRKKETLYDHWLYT